MASGRGVDDVLAEEENGDLSAGGLVPTDDSCSVDSMSTTLCCNVTPVHTFALSLPVFAN